jgi:hypothetical protein
MNQLELQIQRVKKRKQYVSVRNMQKEVFDDLERAKLRLKKFKEWKKKKKEAFIRNQERLNTITRRKCAVCRGFMMAKKYKYCSNKCSYLASYKLRKKREKNLSPAT